MPQSNHNHVGRHGLPGTRATQSQPANVAAMMSTEEELLADVDEPPDLERTPRPSALRLHDSFKTSFLKTNPSRSEHKESLLTHALHSSDTSPTPEHYQTTTLQRGMSCASTWSSNSASTAELTSDGGLTSPATRTCTPSPPLPPSTFHNMVPHFNKKPFDHHVSVVHHGNGQIRPLQNTSRSESGEHSVEVTLGRKRCITFACGRKDSSKPPPAVEPTKPKDTTEQCSEPPKRVCTIKFACPTKVSTDAPLKSQKPRVGRAVSPAPRHQRQRTPSKTPTKTHRDSDSTVRNTSPVSVRKGPALRDRPRRLSANSELARTEAYRFHEFASSEEEVEEWTQESTCHRTRLTVSDTLQVENNLRKLGEEAEEEAMDEDEELAEEDGEDDDDDVDEDILEDDVSDGVSDEGFQTDDEGGFAGSDDESDAGSDFGWWAPGAYSTAATSLEHLEQIRPNACRSVSESSLGSVGSDTGFKIPAKPLKRKRSRPVNIRVPSPELPDSTDFVCGTLDEDRPLEDAYLSCLERRRAAKHKATPQDIDPTFPTSDPEMDEEDEDDEPDNVASESDGYLMMHGQMDHVDADLRGRSKTVPRKRSPAQSPKRLRSPPPAKRNLHRSPPPRKLFGSSPKRLRSPVPVTRVRSPPPTRRGSEILSSQSQGPTIRFGSLAQRPALTMSSSVPRTPIAAHPSEDQDDEDTCREMPLRRAAIDIKIGLENKRQRRKEQLYKKTHRKGAKEKRPPPGKGYERMREMGLGLAAHKGKAIHLGFGLGMPPTPDQKDMHVLSV